jgi:hypothetical protein
MSGPSTRNLEKLPSPERLEQLSKSLAMLDAILCPDWEDRYYSFNARWDKNTRMASKRNGSGDFYFMTFSNDGVFIKGFDHESPMSPHANASGKVWPDVLDGVPTEFSRFLTEPAFEMDDTTFCIWFSQADPGWRCGNIEFPKHDRNDPDGSSFLLQMLQDDPKRYKSWAEDYFELDIPLKSVKRLYALEPLTTELVESLNADITLKELEADIAEIGYPTVKGSM